MSENIKENVAVIVADIVSQYPSQKDCARVCELSQSTLSKLILGKAGERPSVETLKKLADGSKGMYSCEFLLKVCGYSEFIINHETEKIVPVVPNDKLYEITKFGIIINAFLIIVCSLILCVNVF